jgi:ATP-dependent helicase/nuclease subunit A
MKKIEESERNLQQSSCAIVRVEANSGGPSKGDFERMARRRFQDPRPVRRGEWWTLLVWKDHFIAGKPTRKRERIKLAPASMREREVLKVAAEYLRPLNQGLESIGSATNFQSYVEGTYKPVVMPLMASSTRERYEGVIRNYLYPAFANSCLRDLATLEIQRYFSGTRLSTLGQESKDKIRDVLSSILRSAVGYGLLVKNPVEGVRLPTSKRGKRKAKPHITPEQFEQLVNEIPEPYSTMVYVAVYTGLRVSELVGLRWEDVHTDSITVDERYCRGDWGEPKSECSNATIGVDRSVIERVESLKSLTVIVRAGRAKRHYKAVKSAQPNDLVFQSIKDGKPMRDNNVLVRFIKPAARKLGIEFVNWRSLRTSYATWLIEAGANPKDVQGQMRHSRIATTMDIYAQFVPESQQRAISKMSAMVQQRLAAKHATETQASQTMQGSQLIQ